MAERSANRPNSVATPKELSERQVMSHELVLLLLNQLGVRTSTGALILVVQLGLKVKVLCWIFPSPSSSSPHNQH